MSDELLKALPLLGVLVLIFLGWLRHRNRTKDMPFTDENLKKTIREINNE